jgi:hypothetical protein
VTKVVPMNIDSSRVKCLFLALRGSHGLWGMPKTECRRGKSYRRSVRGLAKCHVQSSGFLRTVPDATTVRDNGNCGLPPSGTGFCPARRIALVERTLWPLRVGH